MASSEVTKASTATTGMGELSFPDEETMYLKPALLVKQQQWRRDHPLWSLCFPVPSARLWCVGLAFLLHPLAVILLRIYRHDFQSDWHEALLLEQTNTTTNTNAIHFLMRTGVAMLDAMSVWVIDCSPPLAAVGLFLHVATCLGYLAYTMALENRNYKGKPIKQD